ncbi:hypothetical protein ACVMB0_005037 [Bradyrhizobium sp. USDA 4451]
MLQALASLTARPPSQTRSPFDSISFAKNESESKNRHEAILNNTFAQFAPGTFRRADWHKHTASPLTAHAWHGAVCRPALRVE